MKSELNAMNGGGFDEIRFEFQDGERYGIGFYELTKDQPERYDE